MPGREPPRPPQRGPERPSPAPAPIRRRDQRWALHAYQVVAEIAKDAANDYKIVVHNLGADILRNGLSAALASLERRKEGRGRLLLDHLARAGVTSLENATGDDVARRVRGLDVDGYMIATREILQLAAWLKRAAQATFGDD